MPGKVWLVGAGPDDPGLLTVNAARALAQCDTLVYDDLASPAILSLARENCERMYVGKHAAGHTLTHDEITALIVKLGSEGRNVVRLTGGDVFVLARGGEDAAALAAAGVAFEFIAPARTDNGPLFGKRVLVTRAAHQADDFATLLYEAGAEPLVAPAIALGPPDNVAAASIAVGRLRDYTWIVLTSRNGVDALFAALRERGRDARAFGDARVAAIGPVTAAALAERGIVADLVPAEAIAESAAEALLLATHPNDRVLLYRAQEARSVIPETLRDAGRSVDDVAAYKTAPTVDPDMADRAASADIVTFASASAVDGFCANVADAPTTLAGKTVACIGPVTAAAARAAGIRVDVVAATFTVEGLLEALRARETAAV